MKVEVVVLGSQFLMVSVDVKQQALCESRGGRPGLPVPNSPYCLCGRRATLNLNVIRKRKRCTLAMSSHSVVEGTAP